MGKVTDAGHVAQTDSRVARSRLDAQLVVQIAAVTTITDHVNFICKKMNPLVKLDCCAHYK